MQYHVFILWTHSGYVLILLFFSPPPPMCTHSVPSQLCVSDSLGQVTILQGDGSGLLKQTSTYKAHSYEAWVTAFDCWDPNTLYSGMPWFHPLPPSPLRIVSWTPHCAHSLSCTVHGQCAGYSSEEESAWCFFFCAATSSLAYKQALGWAETVRHNVWACMNM